MLTVNPRGSKEQSPQLVSLVNKEPNSIEDFSSPYEW